MQAGPAARKAAQYLRMSTDQQRYSLENQAAAIALHAAGRGLEIVRTYEDAGVSGLRADNRTGLQRLLADVVGGEAAFGTILVYDISRWGRFQNPDESAHYEFVCRQAGVEVEYCAEELASGGVAGALVKQVRRVMAAEYSRHLSRTVRDAQRRGAAEGRWQGGPPGYGLRRCLVDTDGRRIAILEHGQQKAVQSQHVVLVPGPPEEIEVVREVYRLFLEEAVTRTAIVRRLNADGVPHGDGRPWTYQHLKNILTNPVYAGDQVFGKLSYNLDAPPKRVPTEDRVTAKAVLPAAVPREAQARAARIAAGRMVKLDDQAMLERLSALLKAKGRLSSKLINAAEGLPTAATYHNRFGGLSKAYQAIGYDHAAATRARRAAGARAATRRKAGI